MGDSSIKEKIVKAIQDLPQETTIEQAMEKLYLLDKTEKGIKQADSGQTISHADARNGMKKWLER